MQIFGVAFRSSEITFEVFISRPYFVNNILILDSYFPSSLCFSMEFHTNFVSWYDLGRVPGIIFSALRNRRDAGVTFLIFIKGRPTDAECYAVEWTLVKTLTRKWQKSGIEKMATTVFAHMANIESCLQSVILTSNVCTRSKLQAELKVFTLDNKRHDSRTRQVVVAVCVVQS